MKILRKFLQALGLILFPKNNQSAKVQGLEETKSQVESFFVNRISEKPLFIAAQDGTYTIINNHGLLEEFYDKDPRFIEFGLDGVESITQDTYFDVFEGLFDNENTINAKTLILNQPENFIVTQAQILYFFKNHTEWLFGNRSMWTPNLFLIKKDGKYFIVDVRVEQHTISHSVGFYVRPFEEIIPWKEKVRCRFFIPIAPQDLK